MKSQLPLHILPLLPLLLLLLFVLTLLPSGTEGKRHKIWPHPQEISISDEFYLIYSREFRFLVTNNRCDVINHGVARARDRMFTQDCGKIDPRYAGTFLQPGHVDYRGDSNYRGVIKQLYIRFSGECEHYPQMDMDERYQIRVLDNGIAELLATSVWGVLRGLDTFAQLVENVGASQFTVNKVKIVDYPRFSHRGLMIDTSRHFLSVKSIFKTLNAMELNKLNVLHWHIVDDQAFPFESLSYPQLSEKGAYIPQTHVYRPKDVETIIEYARLRGIRILIEFDTPGHAQSWGKGMPNLLTQCFTNGRPNGAMGPIDPTRQSNYIFLKNLFTEVARRFPDQYLHLGGDEVDTKCWASNPRVQNFMRKRNLNVNRLESFYIQRLVNIVKNLGKSYIVWQEVFDEGVKIKPDTVVHVWIEKRNGGWRKEMSKVTRAGYRTLLSAPWYLEEVVTESWRKYYETDPLDFDGTPQQKKLVLGGEACIWGEYADGGNLINKVWTTTSALAEKLWSPQWLKSAADAEWRFFRLHCRMQVQGIRVGPPSGPSYCPCDHVI